MGARVVVVMPAYNAEATLEQTWRDIPAGVAAEVILVDDASRDRTVEVAERLGLTIVRHGRNRGYGANQKTCYRREVLETVPFEANSDDFVFDSQFLAQAAYFGFRIGDVPVPARYFAEASSINFRRSVVYGLGTLRVLGQYLGQRAGVLRSPLFVPRASAP